MVNNAGILAKGRRKEKPQQTAKMMETNFWGTLNMIKAFYPIINENGRIVNVSGFVSVKAMNKMQLLSRQGKELHSINQSLRRVFENSMTSISYGPYNLSDDGTYHRSPMSR